ncbi:MAG: sulfatase-like hydrolase/transferase [Candidatus Aminicenantes bacterium]
MVLSLFLLFLLIYTGCKRESQLYRFIDGTTAENIISSPLKTLNKAYEIKEQIIDTEDSFLYELDGGKYWAVPAEFPLIADNELEEPEGMVILRKDREIPFIGQILGKRNGWKWTRYIKRIEPDQNKKYEEFKRGNSLILPRDVYFVSDVFYVPKGLIEFQIHAGSYSPEQYGLNLDIYLGERLIKKLPIEKKRYYKFTREIEPGTYKLKIGFSEDISSSMSLKQEKLDLDSIELRSANDFILLSYSRQQLKIREKVPLRATYHTYVGDKKYHLMYLMHKRYQLQDFDIGENPLAMKKKLIIRNQSINTIYAPPKTVLKYMAKIPKSGVFDFGYGLMPEAWRKKGDGVQFHIYIKTKDKEGRLFSSSINPFRHVEHRKVFREKIDLSEYGKGKAEFVFITEKNNAIHNDLSYWCNPCLYQHQEPLNKKKKKPINVILISLDTLRADHLGCYGYSRDTSPSIDSFREDSVLFNHCYSTAASTLVAHMSLMTSLVPKSHQVYNNKAGDTLSPEFLTLADMLRKNGYYCGAFTGGGLVSGVFGFSKGFDEYHEDRYSIFRGNSAETLYKNASDWINQHNDKKFFLFLHTYQPHNPYKNSSTLGKSYLGRNSIWEQIDLLKYLRDVFSDDPPSYPSKLDNRSQQILKNYLFRFTRLSEEEKQNIIDLYDGEIRHTDEYFIKPLMNELRRLDLYENSIIILLSDHGEEFYDHKMWEHGIQLYNELIRVPLIIKYPGSRFKGETIDRNVSLIDVLPSIIKELRITPHSQFEGFDVKDVIEDKERFDRICYAESRAGGRKIAVVQGKNKLIFNGTNEAIFDMLSIPSQIEYYDIYGDFSEKNCIELRDTTSVNDLFKALISYRIEKSKVKESDLKRVDLPKDLEEQLRTLGYIK